MERGDDATRPDRLSAANDNGPDGGPPDVDVDAALTRIAQAIGRHIARQHIRVRKAANDNEGEAGLPPAGP
ncbi:hypothetical protein MOK15_09970 [Sphingobium sp. BYY-5]|uniref:hypothetical protein n=1 Tax=Sphingobium sp. BYY-5 TaxID=2926400 RepID=UPI001FA72AFE|nr:hypothetical protein [Sphingobium sp. BYY-5]MCI4590420.1 hypothetical protein [Sphingobium sp. BYY-5]